MTDSARARLAATMRSDILAWLNTEQRKAERWAYSQNGVYRFALTGPELMRIRHALGVSDGEWQCRFVAKDGRCCLLPKEHTGEHKLSEAAAALRLPRVEAELDDMRARKDAAYDERNQMVAALSKLWPSHLARHPESDESWERDWMTIVCIHSPMGQLTWHLHDLQVAAFAHLSQGDNHWDGHTTEEKYQRLARLPRVEAADPPKTDACQNGHVWTSDDCVWRDGEWDWRCDCGEFGRDFPPDAVEAYFTAEVSVEAADTLRAALKEALNEWADASQYKGDYLARKHGDAERIAELRALLAAPVASAWQPIASAPTNGIIVLLTGQNGVVLTGFYRNDRWQTEYVFHTIYDPTHWMPLPSAPVASAEEKSDV